MSNYQDYITYIFVLYVDCKPLNIIVKSVYCSLPFTMSKKMGQSYRIPQKGQTFAL